MNGISHKQAIQWIHRRLDGLLNASQLSSLDEHLHSCESCRAYAHEMDGLSAHLQNEFHHQWDEKPGPSQNVMEQVTAKARRIPVAKRLSSGVKLLAGALAMILLGVIINFVISQFLNTSSETNTIGISDTTVLPSTSRLLAFTSDQSGNIDIYTIHADGSGMTNLTNHPARDTNPTWSPDGKHIAFESDRNGYMQIYLMNADGSNIIQLTDDEAFHHLPMNIHGVSNPWSPDGTKLIFLKQDLTADTSTLYLLDIQTGTTAALANGNVPFNISWSPDGKYVGYVLNVSPTPDATFVPGIYVVDSVGSNTVLINELLPQTERIDRPSFYWSRDKNSIIFIAYQHIDEGRDQWIAYEAAIESNQLIERARSSTIMEDWWEGTSFIYETSLSTLTWLHSDGTVSTFKPLEICQITTEVPYSFFMRRSSNGNQAINIDCPTNEKWLYYASADGTLIKPLLNSPISASTVDTLDTTIAWSSDDQFIAVAVVSREESRIFILDVNDPSTQPLEIAISDGELYSVPTWRPAP